MKNEPNADIKLQKGATKMFYILTGLTALLGILVTAGAFTTKKLVIRIVSILVGVAFIAYAAYLAFILPEHVFVAFPTFILVMPLIIIGMQIGTNIHAKKGDVTPPVKPVERAKPQQDTPQPMALPVRASESTEKPVTPPLTPVTVAQEQPQRIAPEPVKQLVVTAEKNIPPVTIPPVKPVQPVTEKPFVFTNPDMAPKNKFNLPF